MAFSKEEQQQIDQMLGGGQQQSGQPNQQSGTSSLPPEIMQMINGLPREQASPSSVRFRSGMSYSVPPTKEAMIRELTMQSAKDRLKTTNNKIPSAQVTIINQTKNSLDRLQELQKIYADNPDIQTGPMALYFRRQGIPASIGNLELQYGMKDREKAKKITEIALKTNQTLDQYRRAVTGAQAGFPEIKFLQSAQPDPTRHVRGNLEAALQAAVEEQSQNYQMILDNLDSAGYNTDKFRKNMESGGQVQSGQSQPLPKGVQLTPGPHVDKNGVKFIVNQDGTYQVQ